MKFPEIFRTATMVTILSTLVFGCGDKDGSSAPDLIACNDAAGEPGKSVTLTCQANEGISGVDVSWQVTAPDNSDVAVTDNGLTASFTPLLVGTYNVKATATVGDKTEVESFVARIGSLAPTVSCPSQLSVKANRSVTVDCTTASGHANRAFEYKWTLESPPGVTARLTTDNAEDAVFTPPARGLYTLTVTVTAPGGESVTADVTVNVDPWRIVAIGDSITQSNLLHQSYRYKLWKKLVGKGVDFDLIGTQNTNANQDANGTLPADTTQVPWPDYKNKSFDPDHEAYWGKKAGWVATKLQTTLPQLQAQEEVPDIALVHLGTNELLDSNGGATEDKIAAAIDGLENVIGELRQVNPQVTILLAKIIPYSTDGGEVSQLNQLIDAVDESMSQSDSPVIIVDQYSGFSSTADTFDGIHPNDDGEEKIAAKFFDEIDKIIK